MIEYINFNEELNGPVVWYFQVTDDEVDKNGPYKIFGDSTWAVVDEIQGGVIAYFNSEELAIDLVETFYQNMKIYNEQMQN